MAFAIACDASRPLASVWRAVVVALVALISLMGVGAACSAPDISAYTPPIKAGARASVDASAPSSQEKTGDVDAGPPSPPPPPPTTNTTACGDTAKPFTPDRINPTAERQASACSADDIEGITAVCAFDQDSAACIAARNAKPACAGCIFGLKTDAAWKSIVLRPGETPGGFFNQAGCVDHITKVPGCGKKWVTLVRCVSQYCGSCQLSEATACVDKVQNGVCSFFSFTNDDAQCGAAINDNRGAIDDRCFATGTLSAPTGEKLFKSLATEQCPTN